MVLLIWAQQILLGTFIHASVVTLEIGWAICMCCFTRIGTLIEQLAPSIGQSKSQGYLWFMKWGNQLH